MLDIVLLNIHIYIPDSIESCNYHSVPTWYICWIHFYGNIQNYSQKAAPNLPKKQLW